MKEIGRLPNVHREDRGLGIECLGFGRESWRVGHRPPSLADLWRPYVETVIEAVGADRCMFESNFPVDGGSWHLRTLWNAFKRITASASSAEKDQLYRGTAARVYSAVDAGRDRDTSLR